MGAFDTQSTFARLHLHHGRDVGAEAVMNGKAHASALRPGFVPVGDGARALDDVAQTGEIEAVAFRRLHPGHLEHPGRAEEVESIVDGIAGSGRSQFIDEDIARERVEDVAHAAQPPDAHPGLDAGVFVTLAPDAVGEGWRIPSPVPSPPAAPPIRRTS